MSVRSLGVPYGLGSDLAHWWQGGIGSGSLGGGDDFVDARKLLIPMTFARGAHGGNGAQQELGKMREGGGFLARDAALGEQAENLAKSAVHPGSGAEVAARREEFG